MLFRSGSKRLGEAQLAVSNIIRSVSTIFFVIVNSFAATTGALVSNLIGAGERQYLFPLCRKILKLGYAIGLPLVVLAMVFRRQTLPAADITSCGPFSAQIRRPKDLK